MMKSYDLVISFLVYMHSSSSGVSLWLLIVLLCLTALLLLFLGCFCGARGYYRCALYQIQRKNTKESSSSDEEVAMDVMSRSEKVRESKCKLLKKDGRKKVKNAKKMSTNESDDISNSGSKHGSIEIKQISNGEDGRPHSDHSLC